MPATNARSIWILGLPLALCALSTAASCSSTTPPTSAAAPCQLNSDCEGRLICDFGRCHVACATSKDCTGGVTCLPPGVCELSVESPCSDTLPCVTGLTCADDTCRAACNPKDSNGGLGGCLAGQTCATVSKQQVCIDNSDGGAGKGDGGHGGGDATISDAKGDGSEGDSSAGEGGSGTDAGGDAGCTPTTGDAAVFGYVPSNFDPGNLATVDGSVPDGGVNWTDPPDASCANTGVGLTCLGPNAVDVVMSDGSIATLYVVNNFVVQNSAVLATTDYYNLYPVIIAALGTVEIQGTLNMGVGTNGWAGPGGFPESGNVSLGPGGGGLGGAGSAYPTSGSGGGAYCGAGGAGGGTAPLAPGGAPYGTPEIIPLAAGSAGGGIDCHSGGAVQISSAKSILVRNSGVILAYGASQTTAGGAGGAILLEAPTIDVQGTLAANGAPGGTSESQVFFGGSGDSPAVNPPGGHGSGGATVNGGPGSLSDAGPGGGGGGAGYIRLNAACPPNVGPSAIISPSLAPITACASVGTLKGL